MKTLGDIAPSWHQILPSDDGDVDGCNSTRFTCVMGGEAVLDPETGPVWERVPNTDNDLWASKLLVCGDTNTGGRFGWRLPWVQEFGTRSALWPTESNTLLKAMHGPGIVRSRRLRA
jgi:hypothetical protein